MKRNPLLSLSYLLTRRIFCRFHDSPRFNHIQVDLWERLNQSVAYLLSFKSLFDIDDPLKPILGPCLDEMLPGNDN